MSTSFFYIPMVNLWYAKINPNLAKKMIGLMFKENSKVKLAFA